jgi:uncharacterized protein DUF4410
MPRAKFIGMLVILFLLAILASAQTTSKSAELIKDKYQVIEVGAFEVQQGVELPPEFLTALPPHVVQQLRDSHKFQEVLAAGEKPSQQAASALKLTGMVTGYDEGSRGKRYVGFGMGAARMFVTVRYHDGTSGQLISEDRVVGILSGGAFGGSENKVVEEVARAVTVSTKLFLLKNLEDSIRSAAETPERGIHENNIDRQQVNLKDDLKLAESKMNELAEQGYRLADFRITGNNSAEVTMEKEANPPQTYRYVLVHALRIGKVQENMNKAAADGYRLVPHTLASLHAFAVIMERPPVPADTRYEYRFSSSMLQSNAEKHVTKDQQEGFVPTETGKVLNQNVVISEKATPVQEASR